ncbi:MAG: MotA/TolQ/ExbB proton channel family protein [Planctomycetes bacterium]|nr:MotA/TolQ/ExbB proton channel family protein [Planctomycetota bacterium]
METLVQVFYDLCTSLMIPTMAALLLFLGWAMVQFGQFARENFDRSGGHRLFRAAIEQLKAGDHAPADVRSRLSELRPVEGPVGAFVAKSRASDPLVLSKILDDVQIALNSRAAKVAVGIRIGPMLGLMGTLIPMGPALTGLASGNVADLARNLVVAFTTTVIGLIIGGICYFIQLSRRRWYVQDLSDLDFIHDLIVRGPVKEAP